MPRFLLDPTPSRRAAILVCALGTARAGAASPPEVVLPRLPERPRLAAFLTADARAHGLASQMARLEGFTNRIPRDGEPTSERTIVYLGHDTYDIHAVFVCFDRDPGRVPAHLAGRDRIPGSDDTVAFQLDTFRDLTHAYGFQVNALGVQQDGVWTEGKGWDLSFDAIWHSEGRLTDEGYVVVVSVPFKSLRFPAGPSRSFGLMLFRGITRTNEQGFWPGYSTRIAGRMNQAAVLTGLSEVSPGRHGQAAPYVGARARRTLSGRDPARYRTDPMEARVGADAKLVLRDSVSLDLTANPDFSQVESDEPQVTVNRRFEVFFPEKRPFFLENAAFFETPIPLFFSRRIQDPDFGGRISGRQGRFSIGALAARDAAAGDATVTATRLNRDIGAQSTIGFFASTRTGGRLGTSGVGAIDTRLRLGANWSATAQAAWSTSVAGGRTTATSRASGFAARGSLQRTGRAFEYRADYDERSPGFAAPLGFIDRVDFRNFAQAASFRWFPRRGRLLDFGPDVALTLVRNHDGLPLDHQARLALSLGWPRLTKLVAYRQVGSLRLRRPESPPFDRARELSAPYSQDGWGATFTSSPDGAFTLTLSGSCSDSVNLAPAAGQAEAAAREAAFAALVEFRPSARVAVTFSGIDTRLRDRWGGAPVFHDRILRTRLQFQLSRALSARAIAQYDTLRAAPDRSSLPLRRRANFDLLLTYLTSPGTAVYLGYNDDLANPDGPLQLDPSGLARREGRLLSQGRQVFVKASYLFRR